MKKRFNAVRLTEVKKLLGIRKVLRLAEHDAWLDKLQSEHLAASMAD